MTIQQQLRLLSDQLNEQTVLAVTKDSCTQLYSQHGIAPLVGLTRQASLPLKGALVADRIVGKAAAYLMVYGDVCGVFGQTMSEPAVQVFERHGIPYAYTTLVPHIQNRTQTDMCPMEKHALTVQTPEDAFSLFDSIIPKN